jgi:hypothetical protein
MATSANAANIVSRGITRSIFRWVHIICGIPILGYICDSPSDTHNYAFSVRYVFLPSCTAPFGALDVERPSPSATYFEEIGQTRRRSETTRIKARQQLEA